MWQSELQLVHLALFCFSSTTNLGTPARLSPAPSLRGDLACSSFRSQNERLIFCSAPCTLLRPWFGGVQVDYAGYGLKQSRVHGACESGGFRKPHRLARAVPLRRGYAGLVQTHGSARVKPYHRTERVVHSKTPRARPVLVGPGLVNCSTSCLTGFFVHPSSGYATWVLSSASETPNRLSLSRAHRLTAKRATWTYWSKKVRKSSPSSTSKWAGRAAERVNP
jgi:hypothetical protein